MSKAKIALPIIVAIAGFALAGVVAISKPGPEAMPVPSPPPAQVQVLELTPYSGEVTLRSQGVLRPRHQIELVAQVGGVVQQVAEEYRTGAHVQADSLLLQIDPRDYEVAVVRAEAGLADAQQRLASEKGQAKQAKEQWRDLGDAEANDLFLRKPQLASAKAQVQAAKADLQQAKLNLQRSSVRAPFDGRIIEVKANLGQFINAGTPIASVYASADAEIALPLTASQLALLDTDAVADGLEIQLSGTGANAPVWSAQLSRLGASIDERTRTLDAIAEVPQVFAAKPGLQMGQFLRAAIPSKTLEGLLKLPAQAVRPGNVIWMLDDESRLRSLEVRVVQAGETELVVQMQNPRPLKVVVSYLANARDGMQLQTAVEAIAQ